MKIKINHIGYTVLIKDRKLYKGEYQYPALTTKDSKNQSTIYIKLPLKENIYASLVHEIVHVLQYICEARGIDFVSEMEHNAYIAQYIFNKAIGYEYVDK